MSPVRLAEPERQKGNANSLRGKGRPLQEESEETLRDLYRVAYKHFVLNGYDGASIQAIAKEAGVTRQTIHNRFGSKEQFFQTVIKESDKRLAKSFVIDPLLDSDDPILIFNYLANLLYAIYTDKDKIPFFQVMDSALSKHPEMGEQHSKSLNEAFKIIIKYIRQCSPTDGKPIDASMGAARDFVSLIHGYALPVIQARQEMPTARKQKSEIQAIVLRFLRGIGFSEI